jgi:flagellar protein FliO/FliZ
VAALLLVGAWLFIQVSLISSQEVPPPAEDPYRSAEQSYIIQDTAGDTAPVTGPTIWTVVRMVITLALVAAAVYGIVFLIKRFAIKKQAGSSDPFLKILATAHLGLNRYAHVVSVGSKAWLLGSSDGGVNLIGEVDDKDLINAMLLEDSNKAAEAQDKLPDFKSLLRRLGLPVETRFPPADEIRKRRERLKGM